MQTHKKLCLNVAVILMFWLNAAYGAEGSGHRDSDLFFLNKIRTTPALVTSDGFQKRYLKNCRNLIRLEEDTMRTLKKLCFTDIITDLTRGDSNEARLRTQHRVHTFYDQLRKEGLTQSGSVQVKDKNTDESSVPPCLDSAINYLESRAHSYVNDTFAPPAYYWAQAIAFTADPRIKEAYIVTNMGDRRIDLSGGRHKPNEFTILLPQGKYDYCKGTEEIEADLEKLNYVYERSFGIGDISGLKNLSASEITKLSRSIVDLTQVVAVPASAMPMDGRDHSHCPEGRNSLIDFGRSLGENVAITYASNLPVSKYDPLNPINPKDSPPGHTDHKLYSTPQRHSTTIDDDEVARSLVKSYEHLGFRFEIGKVTFGDAIAIEGNRFHLSPFLRKMGVPDGEIAKIIQWKNQIC